MAELAGQAALVTGGTRGVGALVRRLAREDASVAFTYAAPAGRLSSSARSSRRKSWPLG
jgi:3-oxoacyl-[acyl-carrier protein] reductase